jgi:hypothetical protein
LNRIRRAQKASLTLKQNHELMNRGDDERTRETLP